MKLDLIVPTFNRQALLAATLESILRAHRPAGMSLTVTVVDNNSTDHTCEVVADFISRFEGPSQYLRETRQGKSFALNKAIADTTGDIVGFVDDDEEVGAHWFEVVHAKFAAGDLDFIGGPYYPIWHCEVPAWLPGRYHGAVGAITEPSSEENFGPSFRGILMGGNAVISRRVLESVGPYNTHSAINRSGRSLSGGEDFDMYHRLLSAGAHGRFCPSLVVYHHIPADRVTMSYLRKWAYCHGMSANYHYRFGPARGEIPSVLGIPRWCFAKAFLGLGSVCAQPFIGRTQSSVESELACFELAGQISSRLRFARPRARRWSRVDELHQR